MATDTPTATARGITFFDADHAPLLDDTEMMTPPHISSAVLESLDFRPLAQGSKVTTLFRGDGDDGFSLVHAWFGPGYRLPRHSHSADCLYYVLSGEAIMGKRTIKAGSGFFVRAGKPYAYAAGPDGVTVLEFRAATSFDMQVLDQTVERWTPIVAAAAANQALWAQQRP